MENGVKISEVVRIQSKEVAESMGIDQSTISKCLKVIRERMMVKKKQQETPEIV